MVLFAFMVLISTFNALTMLIRWQKWYPACKKLHVGLLVVTVWLELCTSYSSSCLSPPPAEIQNGDILILPYLGLSWLWYISVQIWTNLYHCFACVVYELGVSAH